GPRAFLLGAWTGSALLLFALGRFSDGLRAAGRPAPAMVPSFHFQALLLPALSMTFAWALARAARAMAARLPRARALGPWLALAAVALIVVRPVAGYAARRDGAPSRGQALA